MGLRWWNEVDTASGDSHWVFESQDRSGEGQNKTDKRFFWLALYAQPGWWVLLAILAVVRLQNVIWLSLVGGFFAPFLSLLTPKTPPSTNKNPSVFPPSHRPRPHNHQHARLLALRQVQPGLQLGFQRDAVGRYGAESVRSLV